MFAIAVSMLYNLFEWRDSDSDSLFSSLTFAMIANDAHSSHGIVLLLVLKVRKLVLFQFGGANDDKGQLWYRLLARRSANALLHGLGIVAVAYVLTISFRGARRRRRRSIEPPSLT
jgi:predicted membrane channel-forming protein YqfA (hemolysin III family)